MKGTVMRTSLVVVLLIAATGLVGCKKKSPADIPPAPTGLNDIVAPAPVGDAIAPLPPAPTHVPAPRPVATPPVAGKSTYTIQKGDTLMKIAREKYGAAARIKDILQANPQITNPNQIQVGQIINLP